MSNIALDCDPGTYPRPSQALMEYHCTKDAVVATKIFEIGLKTFGEDAQFVVRYLGFLISINDENSMSLSCNYILSTHALYQLDARALFERVITSFTPEEAKPIWERWARYEYHFGDLAAAQKLEKRISDVYPNGTTWQPLHSIYPDSFTDPPIKRFAQRFTYLGVDAIASRDLGFGARSLPSLLSPATVTQPIAPAAPASMSAPPPNVLKRAASPEPPPRRRREPSPPPSKRFRQNSPLLKDRDRDRDGGSRWDGPPPRRTFSPRRDAPPPPRREREEEKPNALPNLLTWFVGTLPTPASFDGPSICDL